MTTIPMPYFLENEEWYREVDEDGDGFNTRYELTEVGKSIPKVVASFEKFHELMQEDEDWDA